MLRTSILFIFLFFVFPLCLSGQSDAVKFENAIHKEQDVPKYELPELLKTFEGKSVKSVKQWESKRRPELLTFFADNLYGKIPIPRDEITARFEVTSEDRQHLEGLCTKRVVNITLQNKLGSVDFPMVLFLPNAAKQAVPAIYWANLTDIQRGRFDMEGPQRFGMTKNSAPLKQLMLRGIALVSIDAEAIASRSKSEEEILDGGIIDLFFQEGQNSTKDDEWGLISVWAYAMIRGMDYILTEKAIAADQVAVMGSSIGGKVAIWAAAQDTRLGMVLSATAGHGGDALWKRQFGESLDNMLAWLPRWLGRNAAKYQGKTEDLPVDQHMLLACLAPRPVYVATAQHDLWADPMGQWLSAYHAAPIYQLYGKESIFSSAAQPAINTPIIKSPVGHHLRSGFHGLQQYDWERFMEFMEHHFLKIPIRSVHDIYYENGKLFDHYPNKLK